MIEVLVIDPPLISKSAHAMIRGVLSRMVQLREAKGITQSQIASLMGQTQGWISKLESGRDIKLKDLRAYVKALGYSTNIFIT